jgi:heptosyltransferase-2
MGLDDNLKFWQNMRTGPEILAETWKLPYRLDEYVLRLTEDEETFCKEFRKGLGVEKGKLIVGFNTGCSSEYPLKKMTVDQHVYLIRRIARQLPETKMLLLGGKEDTEINRKIKKQVKDKVIEMPTSEGLRSGILYVNLCDLVVSGDSLGMHIAIGLKKNVVVWFGVSCGAEVELYNRGSKILSDLECSPCWKKECQDPRCINALNLDSIFQAVARYHKAFTGSIVS